MDNTKVEVVTGIVRGRSIDLLDDIHLKDNTKVEIQVKQIGEVTTDEVYGIVKPIIDPLALEDTLQDGLK